MILCKNRRLGIVIGFCFVFFSFINLSFGQKNNLSGIPVLTEKSSTRQDTAFEARKRNSLSESQPDTNFTYEKYCNFLYKISDTSKYIVLPLNEFRKTFNSSKIVIGLRHDVDNDLNLAYKFSETESKLGFSSTYFILHTAPYYLADPNNKSVHSESIIPLLKIMQNEKHFEIGWHNDLVTLQAVYNIDPFSFLRNELAWLRSNGINIFGSASHGSGYCHTYNYLNYYFFEECTYPVVGKFVNNVTLPIGGLKIPIIKGKFSDFNLYYEAYFLDNNKYFSDATITNDVRWNIGMLDLNLLKPGDRIIILLHPVHWHKASIAADIETFKIAGQKSCSIDKTTSTISIEMPYGTDRKALSADFTLSPGAYARVSGKMQVSGNTLNDFTNPLTYVVYSENRDIKREWTIKLHYEIPTSAGTLKSPGSGSILIYPNPSNGIFQIRFYNVLTSPTTLDFFNTSGEKVYSALISEKGTFTIEFDLSELHSGIYFIRSSQLLKPAVIIIK